MSSVKKITEALITRALEANAIRPRGAWKVRPSGIHRCPRAQVLASGLDPDENIKLNPKTGLAFAVGTAIHEIIQNAIPDVPAEETWDSGVMTGHSDLRIIKPGILVDLKTINVEGYLDVAKKGPKPEHIGQVTWYAVQAGCDHAAIVYINKNGTIPASLKADKDLDPVFQVMEVEVNPETARQMDNRAEDILAHVTNKTLPRYAEVVECRWCEVKAACQKALMAQAQQDSGHRWRTMASKVVGTTFRDGLDFSAIAAGDPLELAWDKDNPYGPRRDDGFAQAVKVFHKGEHLGFLPATGSPTAEIVSDHLAAGGSVSCQVSEVTGGGPGKNHGINVEIRLHGSDL